MALLRAMANVFLASQSQNVVLAKTLEVGVLSNVIGSRVEKPDFHRGMKKVTSAKSAPNSVCHIFLF